MAIKGIYAVCTINQLKDGKKVKKNAQENKSVNYTHTQTLHYETGLFT